MQSNLAQGELHISSDRGFLGGKKEKRKKKRSTQCLGFAMKFIAVLADIVQLSLYFCYTKSEEIRNSNDFILSS